MATTVTTISLPPELLREIDQAVDETGWPREILLQAAVRRLVKSERRWRELQRYGQERARALGLLTEEDIEAFLDSLPDED